MTEGMELTDDKGRLQEASGLPLELTDEGRLLFRDQLPPVQPEERARQAMQPVLRLPEAGGPEVLYLMYRDVGWPEDRRAAARWGLRYDITVLSPGCVGDEYVKTLGHFHPRPPGEHRFTYPEVYEVLVGWAVYLLQRNSSARPGSAEEVLVIEAKAGDKVVIPPGFGHVTINPAASPLVMANWVARGFQSLYHPFISMGGAAYHLIHHRGKAQWVPNPRYHPRPAMRTARPNPAALERLGLPPGVPLYRCFQPHKPSLSWLLSPRHAPVPWEDVLCIEGLVKEG